MRKYCVIKVKHACELTMLACFSYYHLCRPRDYTAVVRRLRELALLIPRYGYRRLGILLIREGWHVNAKVIYKLYRKENLGLQS